VVLVTVPVGIERQLHADDRTAAAVYVLKQLGFATEVFPFGAGSRAAMSASASRPGSGVRFAAGAVHPAGENVYV
jgi:hypothetical protein